MLDWDRVTFFVAYFLAGIYLHNEWRKNVFNPLDPLVVRVFFFFIVVLFWPLGPIFKSICGDE